MLFFNFSSDPKYERIQAELQNPFDLRKLNVNSFMKDSDSGARLITG